MKCVHGLFVCSSYIRIRNTNTYFKAYIVRQCMHIYRLAQRFPCAMRDAFRYGGGVHVHQLTTTKSVYIPYYHNAVLLLVIRKIYVQSLLMWLTDYLCLEVSVNKTTTEQRTTSRTERAARQFIDIWVNPPRVNAIHQIPYVLPAVDITLWREAGRRLTPPQLKHYSHICIW